MENEVGVSTQAPPDNRKKLLVVGGSIGAVALIVIGLVSFALAARENTVSPLPEGDSGGTRVIFVSPEPSPSLTVSPSASSSATPRATAKATPKATPKASTTAVPASSANATPKASSSPSNSPSSTP